MQGITGTEFDDLGLGIFANPDPDHKRCERCDAQGAINAQGHPAYRNFHYGIRFNAVKKCPECRGTGQVKIKCHAFCFGCNKAFYDEIEETVRRIMAHAKLTGPALYASGEMPRFNRVIREVRTTTADKLN